MALIQKVFNGEVFIFDSDRRTLTLLIRKAFTDHSSYGHLGDRGFGINKEALEFAIWNGLTVNFLNEGMKYSANPNRILQMARQREQEGQKAIFEKGGMPIYMTQAKACEGKGYYGRGEETF